MTDKGTPWKLERYEDHGLRPVRSEESGVRSDEHAGGNPSPLTPHASPAPEGRKDDEGKARFDLVPADALWEVVRVYTVGASIYGDRNWETGIKWGRVFAAICRHLFSWWRGEPRDQETGINHLAHAAWGCLALLAYQLRGMTEFDDRHDQPPPTRSKHGRTAQED